MKSQNKSQKQSTKNSKLTRGKKLIKNKRFIVGAVIGVVLVASGIIAFVYNSYQNSVVKEGILTKSYMGFFGGGEATIEYKVYGNKKIVQFEEVLCEAAKEKAPYKVCGHLYELAQEFSRFYEHEQVVGGERETELVELVKIYVNVMERGLGVLGIEVPERM